MARLVAKLLRFLTIQKISMVVMGSVFSVGIDVDVLCKLCIVCASLSRGFSLLPRSPCKSPKRESFQRRRKVALSESCTEAEGSYRSEPAKLK